MELIEGRSLGSSAVGTMSAEQQTNVIQSCRHLARMLDIADIGQRDWHAGQILLHHNPKIQVDILIDFGRTTQTWDSEDRYYLVNFIGTFLVLLDKRSGFDRELVWQHFGEPDDWDPLLAFIPRHLGDSESVVVKARDMFPLITSA